SKSSLYVFSRVLKRVGQKANYVQAIPIYLSGDNEVSKYLSEHMQDVDALTGPYIHMIEVDAIAKGDAKFVVSAIEREPFRFPGLTINDLPCIWFEDDLGNSSFVTLPNTIDKTKEAFQELAFAARKTRNARTIAASVRKRVMSKADERKWAFLSGIAFVGMVLGFAIFEPNPSPFQYTMFRIVLALAGAGFVSMTPGFLSAQVGTFIRGGGALAAFVIIFFFAPAALQVPS
ncbi:MAG: hypothetical protein AAFZ11_10065, partial [Pseudomonadota bacterium]